MQEESAKKFKEIELTYNGQSISRIVKEYQTGSGWYDVYYNPQSQVVSNFNLICVVDPAVSLIDTYNKKVDPFVPYTHLLKQRRGKEKTPDEFLNTVTLKPFNTFVQRRFSPSFEKMNPDAQLVCNHVNLFTDTIPSIIHLEAPNSIQTSEYNDDIQESLAKLKLSTVLNIKNFGEAKEILREIDKKQLLYVEPSIKFSTMTTPLNN